MRILTVTHFFEDHGGGIERVAANLCRQFLAAGAEPLWAASAHDKLPTTVTAQAVPLRCLNLIERLTGLPIPIPMPSALPRLWLAIKSSDAVVVHDALYVTSILALIMARCASKPTVLVQHIADVPLKQRLLTQVIKLANSLVARPMVAAADHVFFISDTTRAAFASVQTRNTPTLAFNGVNADIFYPRAERVQPQSLRNFLFVGRFVEKKGLAVIKAVAHQRPDLFFTLAGSGPIVPEKWGLANVRVVRGVSGSALAEIYRAADCFILPSVGEGFPLVIQEAMACGLPILCGSDTARADPGATKWLRGVQIDFDDVDATANRILNCLSQPMPNSAQCKAMAAYAECTYSWESIANKILERINQSYPEGHS